MLPVPEGASLVDLMQTPNEMSRKPLEFGILEAAGPGIGPCLLLG